MKAAERDPIVVMPRCRCGKWGTYLGNYDANGYTIRCRGLPARDLGVPVLTETEQMSRHFASNPYLTFQDVTPEGRLTRIVEVIAVHGVLLGSIRWYGAWRQYVFAPEPGCVFNVGCLKTIETNVRVMNEIRKGRL